MTITKKHSNKTFPHSSDILINKGAHFFTEGKITQSINSFLLALKINPQSQEACFNLGLCYLNSKNNKLAIRYFQKALKINPNDFESLNNLGNMYLDNGDRKEALQAYKKAVKINPSLSEGFHNLGICYQEIGKSEEAIKYYLKSLSINSANERVLNNLAVAYKRTGRVKKAIYYFQEALKENPDSVMALSNLGALIIFFNPKKAVTLLQRAIKKDPKSAEAIYNLGVAYQAMGKVKEALFYFNKTVSTQPEFEQVYGQLYLKLRSLARWKEANAVYKKLKAQSDRALKEKRLPPETPFISVNLFMDPKRNGKVAGAWSRFDQSLVSAYPFSPNYKKIKRLDPIKVGYLSYDYHDHATMHLMLGVLKLHNKRKFKIYAYSYGPKSISVHRKLAIKRVFCFRDIREFSDLEAAQQINRDEIDILVDLKGHTQGCRLGIMALKPAPVSVTWLGFPGTTGASYIDYLIADKIVIPPSERKYYSERVIYLPNTYQPTDFKQTISQRNFHRRDFGLPSDPDTFVFSSFNQTYKISPEVFDVWMRILKRTPESVLWLFAEDTEISKNLINEADIRGVNSARLIFSGSLPKNEHLKRLALSDLALDTFTYNGHTTTSDCLWAGVPVITLEGKHFASRVSASLLTAVNLPSLITYSVTEYESLAVSLAKDTKKLNSIRNLLYKSRLNSPLFDSRIFTKDLENLYEKIWNEYQKKH